MSPLQGLRIFLERDPALRPASTQAGFARLVGRSEVLIRAVEKGRSKMSRKFARKISQLLAVNEEWLMKYPMTGNGIPSADGGKLTHADIHRAVGRKAIEPVFEESEINPVVQDIASHQLIDGLLGMVKAEFTDYFKNPDTNASDPFPEILDWLKKRAEDRGVLRNFDTRDGDTSSRKGDS
ncbi:MAG: helix-turn-helix transcriptional regulator [Luteolibacter sp.]